MNKITGLITNWIENKSTYEEMLYIRNILNKKIKNSQYYADTYHEVVNHISNNKMLDAVKLYKDLTGFGLKESKDACDLIKSQLLTPGTATSTKFTVKMNSGWLTNPKI